MFAVIQHSAAAVVIAFAAALTAFIGAEWAPAANTLLIVILAGMQMHEQRHIAKAKRIAREASEQARDAKYAAGATRRDDTTRPDTGQRRRWKDRES